MKTLIFIISSILFFLFIKRWYQPIIKLWPPSRNKKTKIILGCLPIIFFIVIILVQTLLIVSDAAFGYFNILFYIVLGYSYMFLGFLLTSLVFDLHWTEDALYLNNKASLFLISGEFFVIAIIYVGAIAGHNNNFRNVLIVCLSGIVAWIILGLAIHLCTGIFEKINIERDIRCGIRFFFYLLFSGILLGYACSGNKSFSLNITDLSISWLVLPLTALYIIIELIIIKLERKGKRKND